MVVRVGSYRGVHLVVIVEIRVVLRDKVAMDWGIHKEAAKDRGGDSCSEDSTRDLLLDEAASVEDVSKSCAVCLDNNSAFKSMSSYSSGVRATVEGVWRATVVFGVDTVQNLVGNCARGRDPNSETNNDCFFAGMGVVTLELEEIAVELPKQELFVAVD
jgi:hypothetical protein